MESGGYPSRAFSAPRLRTMQVTAAVCLCLICFPPTPRALLSRSPHKSLTCVPREPRFRSVRVLLLPRLPQAYVALMPCLPLAHSPLLLRSCPIIGSLMPHSSLAYTSITPYLWSTRYPCRTQCGRSASAVRVLCASRVSPACVQQVPLPRSFRVPRVPLAYRPRIVHNPRVSCDPRVSSSRVSPVRRACALAPVADRPPILCSIYFPP